MKRIAFTFALLSLVLGNLLAEENVPESTSSPLLRMYVPSRARASSVHCGEVDRGVRQDQSWRHVPNSQGTGGKRSQRDHC